MFNPEQYHETKVDHQLVLPRLNPRLSRRFFTAASAAVISSILFPQLALAEQWFGLSDMPIQPKEWFPLYPDVAEFRGMHTLFEANGPLDVYDQRSAEAGTPTNFRRHAEVDLFNWYKDKHPKLNDTLKGTTGFCHGVANAIALGESIDPYNYIQLGQLAALHSGDAYYEPGIEQLMEGLAKDGIPFVIETTGNDGYWTRVAYRVNASRTLILATNFGNSPRTFSPNQVHAYIPVPQGAEQNFPPGTVKPALPNPEDLARWTFKLNRELIG